MRPGSSTPTCSASTARTSEPPAPRPGRGEKNPPPGEPADHALGRSRGGFGTKVHVVTDGRGLPLAADVTAGQRHESTRLEAVMDQVRIPNRRGRPRCRPVALAGD